jgi:ornithine carbamoyltransferase
MSHLKGRDLKGILDLNRDEIETIIDVAGELKRELKMGRPHRLLEGKSLGGIFETPSTRTSISFETAMTQLGGHMIWLDSSRLWVGDAAEEDWRDTIKTIDRYLDGVAYRVGASRERLDNAAEYAEIPMINASCPVEHPCQAFADLMTMREKKGDTKGCKVAFMWGYRDANPPAGLTNSLMLMAGTMGFDISVACPEGYEPHPDYFKEASRRAEKSGGKVQVVRDYESAARDADFINVYSWVSPEVWAKSVANHFKGDPEFQAAKLKLKDKWCVNQKVVDMAKDDVMVMHPMPIARNEEVTNEVLDSDKCIIYDVAENRLHTEKAILALLLGGYR